MAAPTIDFGNKQPATLRAYLDDPKCEDWLRPQLEKLLRANPGDDDDADLALSHRGHVQGFADWCAEQYAATGK